MEDVVAVITECCRKGGEETAAFALSSLLPFYLSAAKAAHKILFIITQRLEMITRFSYTPFSVFDSLSRTIADAGHAVRAFFFPDRLLIDQADIIYRTSPDTLPAACA